MPRQAKELSPLAVKNLKTPGLHFVGGVTGLALQVLPAPSSNPDAPCGGRTWVLRTVVGGKRRDMGLGGFPDVPLAAAKAAAREARDMIRKGEQQSKTVGKRSARDEYERKRVAVEQLEGRPL